MDATEDDQLQAAITASLTEVSKPVLVKDSDSEIDSDSELETFTDSEEDEQCVGHGKTKQYSGSDNKSQAHSSSKSKHSPKDKSKDKSKDDISPERSRNTSPSLRSRRCKSPLTGSSVSADSVQKSQRKISPHKNRQSSPAKDLPGNRKISPSKCSPEKSKSIHNEVHPVVLENIRRNSTSEDDELNDSTVTRDSEETSASCTDAADSSLESLSDPRDYKSFLGPDTGKLTNQILLQSDRFNFFTVKPA